MLEFQPKNPQKSFDTRYTERAFTPLQTRSKHQTASSLAKAPSHKSPPKTKAQPRRTTNPIPPPRRTLSHWLLATARKEKALPTMVIKRFSGRLRGTESDGTLAREVVSSPWFGVKSFLEDSLLTKDMWRWSVEDLVHECNSSQSAIYSEMLGKID